MSLAARVAVTPTVPDMDYYPFKRGGQVEHHYCQLPGMHRDRGQRRVPAHRVSSRMSTRQLPRRADNVYPIAPLRFTLTIQVPS